METTGTRPVCPECGLPAVAKGRAPVELGDLAVFGRPQLVDAETARLLDIEPWQAR